MTSREHIGEGCDLHVLAYSTLSLNQSPDCMSSTHDSHCHHCLSLAQLVATLPREHNTCLACADDFRWLESEALQTLKHMLPLHMWQWLTAFMANTEPPKWVPFHCNANQPSEAQLMDWQKHAKLPASFSIPECLGARAVRDLEHVSPEIQLTVARPVQQARLRWALRSYQDQLANEKRQQGDPDAASASSGPREQNERERADARQQAIDDQKPVAQKEVAAAYETHSSSHNVHGFIKQLSSFYGRLNVEKLPPKPVQGTADWKAKMFRLLHEARRMAHPDKCPYDSPPLHHAMALETWQKLSDWMGIFKH